VTSAGYDLAAEQAVIGAALLAPHLMTDLAAMLAPGDFGRPAHGVLWEAMCAMHAAGTPTDPITVTAHLAETGDLGRVGGAPYLHTLTAEVPAAGNAAHYAGIVADLAKRRSVADLGAQLAQLATSGADAAEVVATGRALLDDAATPGGWPALIPLGAGRHLPPFPAELLPGWLADHVHAVAEFTQTPLDLPGSLALACLSTAAGGRAEVEVRGSWREPTNLYTVVALPPGSRKSAVFAAMTAPILAAEKALIEKTAPAIIEAELAAKVAGKAAERAAVVAASADTDRDALIAEAAAAAMTADAITVPAKPRLVADDVTSEMAASLLAEQGGRLAVLSPEGGIFATIAGRYSGTPNLEVFLKGHAGDLMRVDRRSREAEHVDKPALTLGLAVQPEILRDIAGMPGFRGLGLLARILFAVPENTVGRRKIGADPIPTQVAADYHAGLHALVLSLAEWTDPALLLLTPDANERVLDIERQVEPRLAPGGAWSHIVDWGSKYTGAVVRIAGLLHLAEHLRDGWGNPVTADTLTSAATIGEYYSAHALAAFDDMGADAATRNARHLLAWIERTTTSAFTKREAFRATQTAQIKTMADLDPALAALEAHGYLRQLDTPAPKRAGGRPPSPSYLVHPDVHRPAATVHPLDARRAS
jgi:replicative DNA helicase